MKITTLQALELFTALSAIDLPAIKVTADRIDIIKCLSKLKPIKEQFEDAKNLALDKIKSKNFDLNQQTFLENEGKKFSDVSDEVAEAIRAYKAESVKLEKELNAILNDKATGLLYEEHEVTIKKFSQPFLNSIAETNISTGNLLIIYEYSEE